VPAPDPLLPSGGLPLAPILGATARLDADRSVPVDPTTTSSDHLPHRRGNPSESRLSAPTFTELGVPQHLVAALGARGIRNPFPIQAATLPGGLAGRDLSGRAPTGSGKTIAFGLPLLARIGRAQPRRPRGLVLVPTRELASQVRDELADLAGGRPSVSAIYGGVGFDRQISSLRRGVDIVVACPGRLADLVGQCEIHLDAVETVVIDEADRLADMGFLPEVRRLLDRCPTDRQTLLFSATLDGDVDVLVKRYQRRPARHELVPAAEEDRAEHFFWRVDRQRRVEIAAQVIDRVGPTIVFCRTKHGADRVARQLGKAGVTAAAIHGARSQNQRERALRAFHRGDVAALVATDVAARGIHVDDVAGVIHFDPPADHKDYTHRSGRTARAGRSGTVVTFVPDEAREPVRLLQKKLGLPSRVGRVELDALAPDATRKRPTPRGTHADARPGSRRARPRPGGARRNGARAGRGRSRSTTARRRS
jgi:superfamily II DNA/RNA helicase